MIGVLESIVDAARKFLVSAQEADGFWRDYLLPPGMSTSWTTACVALALGPNGAASDRARQALHSERRPSGWAYNGSVSTDADSTAWVLRFMAAANDSSVRDATALLRPFVTDSGGVRTFRDPEPFGRWAQEHADVTAVAGLALVECGGDGELIERIRDWCITAQRGDGAWTSFWWGTDAYATAKTIEFLTASGVKSETVFGKAVEWISAQRNRSWPFEAAHALAALAGCGFADHEQARGLIDFLCDSQAADGGWPASRMLLVPDQHRDDVPPPAFEDCRRFITTATCLQALRLWADCRA
jgi:hypothetical protein